MSYGDPKFSGSIDYGRNISSWANGWRCARCGTWVYPNTAHWCWPLPVTEPQIQILPAPDRGAEIAALRARVDELERRLAALKPEVVIDRWEDPVL